MTLTEIVRACEVEDELHRDKDVWAHPDYSAEHFQVTNDLIKELALHVKQMKIHICRLEDVIYHGRSTVGLTIKPRPEKEP